MSDDIIEAAARALEEFRQAFVTAVGDTSPFAKQALLRADAALAVLPLIRAAALERAAKVAEEISPEIFQTPSEIAAAIRAYTGGAYIARDIAAAIRALKDQP